MPHRKHKVSVTMNIWLILFREIIAVYCENYSKHTKTLCGKDVATSKHCALHYSYVSKS